MRLFPVFCAVLVSACAHRQGSTQFPSEATLAALRKKPRPSEVLARKEVLVDRWALAGPFPATLGVTPRVGTNAFEKLVDEQAAARPGLVVHTDDMACLAREVGRFVLEHGAAPSSLIDDFMALRCGTTTSQHTQQWLSGDAPADATDDALFAQWEKQAREQVKAAASGGTKLVGAWFGRKGAKAVFLVAAGARELTLAPGMPARVDGGVVLEGELLTPGKVGASVTRGALGYEDCVRDDVPAPQFRVRCPVVAEEPLARVAVHAFRPGRLLGDGVLEAFVYPQGTPPNEFVRAPVGAARPSTIEAEFSRHFVDAANEARATLELPPLLVDTAQSDVAQQLAPIYFSAAREDAQVHDQVALGLMAGYQVQEAVRNAEFTSSSVTSSDAEVLLEATLSSPVGRKVLLSKDVARAAVGTVLANGRAGVVLTTYATVKAQDWRELTTQVITALNAKRRDAGQPLHQWTLWPTDTGARVANAVRAGQLSVEDGLQEVLDDTARVANRAVLGWSLTAHDLDDIDFPKELLGPVDYDLFATATFERPKGEPWARYVIFLVRAEKTRAQTAAR